MSATGGTELQGAPKSQLPGEVLDPERSERQIDLIRSTYRVIARHGHRLSLQDIADEAGVSKGLILYHFKTKDRLLLATMRWTLHQTTARIRKSITGIEDPRDIVAALIDAVFTTPQQNREFYLFYLDLVDHSSRDPWYKELSTLLYQIVNGLYAEVIGDAVKRGAVNVDDVDDAAASVRAHIEGTFVTWMQRADWEQSHAQFKKRCEGDLLRLLGVA